MKTLQRFPRLSAGLLLLVLAGFCAAPELSAQRTWQTIGPDGGDARSLTSIPGSPNHLYLGTANSTIYESFDGGASWKRLAKLDPADDMVIAHIVLDRANPSRIFVAGWRYDKPEGGLYISRDGGHHWTQSPGLRNQSIFALAQSPSDARVLVAGTLEGVYRSEDSGSTWSLISPEGSHEIHEVESIAINPVNPDIIYAGTWHLPWKTTDGGQHWQNIKEGVIEDSDVFSIIVDPVSPATVYLSACSGIYKSESAGKLFHKIQGIPSAARRTRKLSQDPDNRGTVYAGTTEGLYKTTDGGKSFERMTGSDVIVNDVWIDPGNTNHVLLATDRGGVLASDDGGKTFAASNRGFSSRKVEALLIDARDPARIYAGVVNDKTYGGAFVSSDRGAEWKQISDGLNGRDVFALSQAQDGTILAGTNSGIFALSSDGTTWEPRGAILTSSTQTITRVVRGKRITTQKTVQAPPRQLESRVYALDASGDAWVAVTAGGIFTSTDQGATWQGGPTAGVSDYRTLAVHGKAMAAANPSRLVLSSDSGQTWMPVEIPTAITHLYRVAYSADGTLWLGASEGVYFTRDAGQSWMWLKRLPLTDVSGLSYDASRNVILASSHTSDLIYAINAKSLAWTWQRTGFPVYLVKPGGGGLLAASLSDGVLAEHVPAAQAQASENGQTSQNAAVQQSQSR